MPGDASSKKPATPLKIGLIFNLKRKDPSLDDADAEFDSPTTVQAIHDALVSLGHEVVDLEARANLPAKLLESPIDLAFNIAEGSGGRSREAIVPALLDLYGVEYTGSDPTTLSITLDKALAKRVTAQAGVPTAPFVLMFTGKEKLPKDLTFPVVVKPNAEGSSKGVFKKSVANDEAELREIVKPVLKKYPGGALVESFLPGREFTIGILGSPQRPRVLPPMEIVFLKSDDPTPIYTFEHKLSDTKEVRYDAPAKVDEKLRKKLEQTAAQAYHALSCRDVARIDVRLDAQGEPRFIECNPLPGLTPGWSDLCMIATSAGLSYEALIEQILAPAIKRHKERQKHRRAHPNDDPNLSNP